jgi:hypothetical protein
MAVSARVINSDLRVDLGMESPGDLLVMFFRVAGICGASEISFFVFGCLSRYIAASVVLFLVFWVYIRCCGSGDLWFRLTATHFFYKRLKKVSKKTLAPAFGPRRLGSLRSGTDPGAAATVCCAAPPSAVSGCARRSLRSHARINPSTQPSDVAGDARSRALELALIVEWLEASHGVGSAVWLPLTPALSRGRGSRFWLASKFAYDSVIHVGASLTSTTVSSLSLWERARVRGF